MGAMSKVEQADTPAAHRMLRFVRGLPGWHHATIYRSPKRVEDWVLHDGRSRAIPIPKVVLHHVTQGADVAVQAFAVEVTRHADQLTGERHGRPIPLGADPEGDPPGSAQTGAQVSEGTP